MVKGFRGRGLDGGAMYRRDQSNPNDKRVFKMTWQSIETAPKDGTNIIVYYEMAEVEFVHIAWYRDLEETEGIEDEVGWWSNVENSVSVWLLDDYREPTYWMPFPRIQKERSKR